LSHSVYIHIPFCSKACSYCDFHFSTLLEQQPSMMKAICDEIALRIENPDEKRSLSSIYFGGGTPGLLDESDLRRVMQRLEEFYQWDDACEITLEVNPENVTVFKLREWLDNGINRLSIGVQSLDSAELKWMNRSHSAVDALAAIKLARQAGFANISADLIYGSRFQTLISWRNALEQIVSTGITHLSAYQLTVEARTALGMAVKKGKELLPDEELIASQFSALREFLMSEKFIQYEISNFGKEGFFSRHNSNYWLGGTYQGFGPSAHSFNGISRQWNLSNNSLYIKKVSEGTGYYDGEVLGLKERYNEHVLTRLRTIWGCDLEEMAKKFGTDVAEHFRLEALKKKQFFVADGGVLKLNGDGMLYADGIASDLFLD
jgi:oxygen-independent coproporphyrinogen-3 oxidase